MFDHNSYADSSIIIEHFVSNISQILPTIHPISRYDITSMFYKVGRKKVIQNIKKTIASLN